MAGLSEVKVENGMESNVNQGNPEQNHSFGGRGGRGGGHGPGGRGGGPQGPGRRFQQGPRDDNRGGRGADKDDSAEASCSRDNVAGTLDSLPESQPVDRPLFYVKNKEREKFVSQLQAQARRRRRKRQREKKANDPEEILKQAEKRLIRKTKRDERKRRKAKKAKPFGFKPFTQ